MVSCEGRCYMLAMWTAIYSQIRKKGAVTGSMSRHPSVDAVRFHRDRCWSIRRTIQHWSQACAGHPHMYSTDMYRSLWPTWQPSFVGWSTSREATTSEMRTVIQTDCPTVWQAGLPGGPFSCTWQHSEVMSWPYQIRTRWTSGDIGATLPGELHRDYFTTTARLYTMPPSVRV